ncbi:HupE/UreJ family protein [Streptomyces sp. SID12488]|uniref:HupE/UreJ family protein n=1 Tax=Streptomyces sp. SID12488 TaxID=2706040 RepID=UPI0013DC666A|nr:HupE/UreJ family protein [Streptomyces sp. SID12488]NEA66588.1 HupE/UreJ family protein [Streptomyces sp. SID12488]
MSKPAYRLLPALLLAAFFLTSLLAPTAEAHPMATSAVLLDIGDDSVTGEIQLPLDRLSIAVDRDLTGARVLGTDRAFLKSYTAQHISAVGKDGKPWTVELGTGTVRSIDASPHLVYPLEIRPPDGDVTAFDLQYDVIVEELLTHKVIVTVGYDFDRGILKTDDAETLGVFDHATKTLTVPADEGSWLRGFAATAALGIEHIGEGADHLLFLLMLLIPAPLVAAGGSWRPAASRRRAIMRVVHVVSAFAVGHSLTLALAATGVIDLPTRPVETLIALSIAVSAIHAIRPLVAHGEVVIASGFGLIHGLAFASLITDLGLDRGSLVTTLLGFNLGIELTQLLVVALLMPSLLVLARTRFYPAFRITVAVVGLLFSSSWMLERATLTSTDPFEGVQTWLVGHPLWVATTVACLAAAAHGAGTRTHRTAQEH